ncbi:unnamed protein product [Symbiodinium sp. CCMP2592]|nr:unnamed protein product [Symbiodinium sp. CCMP2592]
MPGNLGVYATESLSAASAPESAYTAMGEMSRQRAGQWREQHGLLSDSDFAFSFQSYEEAMAQAGTLVSEEWAAVRATSSSGLYGAVASALESASPDPKPAVRRPSSFRLRVAAKGRVVRKQPAAPKEEAKPSDDHVEALTEALYCLGSMRPRGDLTVGLEREWRAALQRKAEAKAREAEAATVRGALLTFSELQIHMTDRGRAFPPDGVDLDAFLYGGTAAQSRALAGLRWLVKAGQLEHDLSAYDFRGQPNREPKHAAVAEPPMLEQLQTRIEQLYNSNNPQWRAVLGLCVLLWGAPPHTRGSVFPETAIEVHLPLPLLQDWRALPVLSRQNAGINFNEFGAAQVSTYSFRRVGPSFATLAGWSPQQQLSLGDWQDGTRLRQEGNSMPLRYASTRYTASVRRKHCLINAVAGLVRFTSWDEVTQEALEAAERDGALGMDRAVQKDNHTLWRDPATVSAASCGAGACGSCRHDAAADWGRAIAGISAMSALAADTAAPFFCSRGGTGTRAKAGAVVLKPKAKTIQVKAMPKSRGALAGSGSRLTRNRDLLLPRPPVVRASLSQLRRLAVGRTGGRRDRQDDAAESRALERHFDSIATIGGKRIQPPTKLWESREGGTLWLSGMPTAETLHAYPRCDLQLSWLTESLTSRGGAIIPGALQMQVAITDARSRDRQWKECRPVIRQTLVSGGSVLGHCVAGRHRAATGQALLLALLTDVPFEQAQATVGTIAQWVRHIRRTAVVGVRWPIWHSFQPEESTDLSDQAELPSVSPAMASFSLVPRDGADFRATMESLQLNFEFSDDVLEALVKQKIKNLEEFRYFFESEGEIGLWVQKLSLGDQQPLQTARLRRTWAAVKVFFQHADAGRVRISEADLDDLLDDSALRDMKQQFWRRYKTRFPPELYPSDATLSRVTRELNKRMLCVFSVWKVKSLQFQLLSTSKKRKLRDNLYTEDQDQDEVIPRDCESYLDRLQILLTAYALAGVQPVAGSPPANGENTVGSDTTQFVHAPLDVLMEYFHRAKRSVSQVQGPKKLSWLQHKDTEERAVWVSKFRESTKTLGAVVREVLDLRDAHWIPVQAGSASEALSASPAKPPQGSCIAQINPCYGGSLSRQSSLAAQLQQVDFIAAAFDCSTKSRARDIPRSFEDGRPAPRPLRSASCPEGLGGLSKAEQERVDKDNRACSFVLDAIQHAAEKGVGSVRENPANSLRWLLPQEVQSFQSGLWQDKHYDACCWGGARYKRQRHNLQEIADWPAIQCHHIHGKGEWDPQSVDGKHWFPSQEEAEYTAPLAFAIAVSASWWAARVGRAKLAVPRMPVPGCVGRREAWTSFDPRALRAWVMAPLAISLGLTPRRTNRIPQRRAVAEIQCEDGLLPPGAIYITIHTACHAPNGQPPWWRDNLGDQLPELFGKTLVVDEITAWPSEGDALAGLVFEELSDRNREATPLQRKPPHKKRRSSQIGRPLRALGLAVAPLADASQIFSCYLRQEDVFGAVCKLFPAEWLEGVTFPFLEDLINAPPFDLYTRWLRDSGADWTGPCGPTLAPQSARIFQRAAGQQAGALSQRAALPPLLSFGLSEVDHFCHSLARLHEPVPTEREPILDPDLRFAADFTAANRTSLRSLRQHAIGAVRELKRRWAPVDVALRRFPSLRRVTVMGDWRAHNARMLSRIGPSKDDVFLLQQSTKDHEAGFCSPPLTKAALLRRLKGRPYRLIPRCVITQSSGKQRIIDNADAGGQSETSHDSNKLVLCSALRPGQHAPAIVARVPPEDLEEAKESDSLESGGEDWPDAYRHCPMSEEESLACLVVWWHHEWQAPAYQIYAGLLFGLPLAVTSFNRYSRFSEAASRRLALTVASSYFDDFNLLDWASSKGSGQWAVGSINTLLGTPFAAEKRQPMSAHGTFLGLDHDLSEALSQGFVTFWARERLFDKMADLIEQATSSGSLRAGLASKMFGLMNFLEQGMYGRVGLTEEIRACFRLISAILRLRPQRQFWIMRPRIQRFIAASDAAEEAPLCGSGGFLIVWQHLKGQLREGFVAESPASLYPLWGPGEKKIAQLELSMVLYALVSRPSQFRSRRGVWYIDNTAALMSLIRGRSDNADLSRLAQLIPLCLFCFKTWAYWEWVPSKSNWSDSISREGADDVWHQSHLFSTFRAHFPHELWALPLEAVVVVLEFL